MTPSAVFPPPVFAKTIMAGNSNLWFSRIESAVLENLTLFYIGVFRTIFRRLISRLLIDRFSKFFFPLKDFQKFYLKIVRSLF